MKQTQVIFSKSYLFFCAGSLFLLSLLAFIRPQAVMDLVQVQLPNTDAISSIRGVYGGVGLTLALSLAYLARTDYLKGLQFLTLFWGFYAISRLITVFAEGQLGTFGTTWLVVESLLALLAALLWRIQTEKKQIYPGA